MSLFMKLFLGMPSRDDAIISSMTGKDKKINPGDIVKLGAGRLVESVSNKTDTVYGVAVHGLQGDIVPVMTSGHAIAHVNESFFENPEQGKCYAGVTLVHKVKAINKRGLETDAWEVKL